MLSLPHLKIAPNNNNYNSYTSSAILNLLLIFIQWYLCDGKLYKGKNVRISTTS